MLQVKNLEKTYANGISALKGVSLELAAGQSGLWQIYADKAISRLEHMIAADLFRL